MSAPIRVLGDHFPAMGPCDIPVCVECDLAWPCDEVVKELDA